jgi:hypothetical protein
MSSDNLIVVAMVVVVVTCVLGIVYAALYRLNKMLDSDRPNSSQRT